MTLRETFRWIIEDHLVWIYIDDKENDPLVHKVLEKDGSWKGKQRIVLIDFDLHNKEVEHDNGMQLVTAIAYVIRTLLANTEVLKNGYVKYQ